MSMWFLILTQFTIITYALVGGVFLAFSDFIMRALAQTSGDGGAEAMQHINRTVFRWVFMTLFLGLAPVSLFLAVYAFVMLSGTSQILVIAAGLIYLAGCFGVTVRFNVPMNEALDGMQLGDVATQAYWQQVYLPNWTYWNTVRTISCTFSALLMLIAYPALLR